MNPEMALARTAARGGRYEVWTPSTGTVTFTPQDAAGALAGAPRLGGRLLLVKYGCGTPRDERELAIELGFAIASLVQAPRHTNIAGISIMQGVVAEGISPVICGECGGIGWVKESNGQRWIPCVPCEGTGKGAWSNARRARECGVHRDVLRTTSWGLVYDEARRHLFKDELLATVHMARRLRGF